MMQTATMWSLPSFSCTSALSRHQILLYLLLLLSIATPNTLASPVSSPEIEAKSSKSTANANNASKQYQKTATNPQDTHLNSITVYATNYDTITTNANTQNHHFKPSFKLPDMETNFTPIQTISAPSASIPAPTPVIMQYVPQAVMQEGGVQYMQLIPARPLIVPINSYQPVAGASSNYRQTLSTDNFIPDYVGRQSAAMLSALPTNHNVHPVASTILDASSHSPYKAVPTYANTIQPYRNSFRINREIKDKHGTFSLNLNEYVPGPRDPPRPTLIKGRP